MDTTTSISNKNAIDLLKSISHSNNLQKSRDSIFSAEDQYPENLDPIFSKSDLSTSHISLTYYDGIGRRTNHCLIPACMSACQLLKRTFVKLCSFHQLRITRGNDTFSRIGGIG
jgi:hypothetical protein